MREAVSVAHLSNRKEQAGRPDLAPSGSVFFRHRSFTPVVRGRQVRCTISP